MSAPIGIDGARQEPGILLDRLHALLSAGKARFFEAAILQHPDGAMSGPHHHGPDALEVELTDGHLQHLSDRRSGVAEIAHSTLIRQPR